MKTSELTGAALDWAVAKCEGHSLPPFPGRGHIRGPKQCWINVGPAGHDTFSPSTDWSQGGPIIGREDIQLLPKVNPGYWSAMAPESKWCSGPTPLIAAMRCFVASKLGDEVEVPDELA